MNVTAFKFCQIGWIINPFLDQPQWCCLSSVFDCCNKTPAWILLNANKSPLTFHNMTTMVLPFPNLALIYLHHFSRTTNFLSIIKQSHLTDLTTEHVPTNCHTWAKGQLLLNLPLFKILTPPVRKFQHFFYCQVPFFKAATLSNAPLTFVLLSIKLLPRLPYVAIKLVVTFNPFHVWTTKSEC